MFARMYLSASVCVGNTLRLISSHTNGLSLRLNQNLVPVEVEFAGSLDPQKIPAANVLNPVLFINRQRKNTKISCGNHAKQAYIPQKISVSTVILHGSGRDWLT